MEIEKMIFAEHEYTARMDAEAEPYLLGRRRELWVAQSGKKEVEEYAFLTDGASGGKEDAPVRIAAGDGKIHVLFYRADEPVGTVVISHGFTEAEPKYHEIIYYFLRQHYHVYMPEHCGHGKSYRLTSDPSLVHIDRWERYAADFIRVSRMARREQPELPLYLYGHSMGGGIAAAAAALAPELYDKVVLSSPMIRPLTDKIPWSVSAAISHAMYPVKKAGNYVVGQKPFSGDETFAESSGVSEPRFARNNALKCAHREFQTSASSYGWLHESLRMSGYLLTTGCKQIEAPVLLLHPQNDALVSVEAQEKFADRMNKKAKTTCAVEEFADVKHELFNSDDATLLKYWGTVFSFLGAKTPMQDH